MPPSGMSLHIRLALWSTCLGAAVACTPHAPPSSDTSPGAAQAADSAQSAQIERSRSSASQVVEFPEDERSRYARVEQMIQARFSGVRVISTGSNYIIRIRGSASLTSSNDPLVVIDGANRSIGDLRTVSPGDVKRIEIVKDGAGSFYGSRGANGIIIITTGRDP